MRKINFHKAIQKLSHLSIEIGDFVKLIFADKITPVEKGTGTGLAAILFDAEEIELFSKREAVERRGSMRNMREAARLLHTNNNVTTFLVKRGLLIPKKTGGRGDTWSIAQEEIDRFNFTYGTTSYLADVFGASTRWVSDRLMATGIMPVTGPKIDGGITYFFKKTDLAAINPADLLP
jgi:hypothetical protein